MINRESLWSKLKQMGVPEKMVNALQCICCRVQCCLRLNGISSSYFNVSSGLKQGCLLSPILLNLFLNDLILELEASGCGIDIGEEKVCILCYADDLVIISETYIISECLQTMLDIVKQWCSKWSMAVNTNKTQIVHFRAASMPRSNYTFTYGDLPIVISERYKYLGLIMNEFLDYQYNSFYSS